MRRGQHSAVEGWLQGASRAQSNADCFVHTLTHKNMSSLQAMGSKYQGKKRTAPHPTQVCSAFVDPPHTSSCLLAQPVKKRKLLNGKAAPAHLSKKQKVKAVIEIPDVASGSDPEIEEEDLAFFQLHSQAGEFLQTLDKTAIARCVYYKCVSPL